MLHIAHDTMRKYFNLFGHCPDFAFLKYVAINYGAAKANSKVVYKKIFQKFKNVNVTNENI